MAKGHMCPHSLKINMKHIIFNSFRAHSKVVLRRIRIAEAGVRFSLGPPFRLVYLK
jgi:hypothetical protein